MLRVLSELLISSLQDLGNGHVYTPKGNPSTCLTWAFDIEGFIFGFYTFTVNNAILSRHLLVLPVLRSHKSSDIGLLPELDCLLEPHAVELFRVTELNVYEARYRQSRFPLGEHLIDSRKHRRGIILTD